MVAAPDSRPAWFDEHLFDVESKWIMVDGCHVHYVDEGSGPTLLMLHGNPTWSFLYRRMIAGLSDRFRCVALDYPGFGLSTARPDYGFLPQDHARVVQGLVSALGLTGITPVVQDWGGPIGLAALFAEPDRYAGLIVGNTWAWPVTGLKMTAFSELMGGAITGPFITKRLNVFVDRVIPQGMRRRSLTDAEMAMYKGPFPTVQSREPVQVFPRQITAAAPFLAQLAGKLPSLTDLPSLVFWADKDIAFSDSDRTRWQHALRARTDHTLAGAGHYWQDDAGEEAALVIRRWFDTAR